MIPLIIIVLFAVMFLIVRFVKKVTSAEAEKIATTFYETIKLDENKKAFQLTNGKEIRLTQERNRLINMAILFSLVEFAFKKKMPNITIVDIIRWFSLLARELVTLMPNYTDFVGI